MSMLVCDECGKRYNFEKDEFCPRCGAFNQPVKRWGMDANGNVIRVDGVNEENHDGSFVHSEVHHEKSERRKEGLDWQTSKKRKAPPSRPAPNPYSPQEMRKKNQSVLGGQLIGIIIAVIIFLIAFISSMVS